MGMKTRQRKTTEVEFPVKVTETDIEEGKCRLANKCMVKVAILRTLRDLFQQKGTASIKVRVDAGHIWAVFNGFRWKGDMPKIAAGALIHFDQKKPVHPFSFKCRLRRGSKVVTRTFSPERRKQINEARRRREAATGTSDHRRYRTLRKRVVGFA